MINIEGSQSIYIRQLAEHGAESPTSTSLAHVFPTNPAVHKHRWYPVGTQKGGGLPVLGERTIAPGSRPESYKDVCSLPDALYSLVIGPLLVEDEK